MRAPARLLVVVALLGVLLAACGIPTDDEPRPLADESPTTAPETVPADADSSATVYLVQGTNALEAVTRGVTGDETPIAVLRALLTPPTEEELDDGLSTSIPPDTTVRDVTSDGDLVAVDLSVEWDSLVQPAALLAYAQVVLTLTELPGVERVRFLVMGEDVPAPTINQGDLDVVDADDYASLVPA